MIVAKRGVSLPELGGGGRTDWRERRGALSLCLRIGFAENRVTLFDPMLYKKADRSENK